MKRALAVLLSFSVTSALFADPITDVYTVNMSVQVPRVYDNTQSLGYRQYQTQTIRGHLCITFDEGLSAAQEAVNPYAQYFRPIVWFMDLTNQTHKINGQKIGYACTIDMEGYMGPIARVNLIGSNKTGKFETPSVVFYLDAEPDYAIGPDDEDNSLLVTMSARGSTVQKSMTGYRTETYLSGSSYCTRIRSFTDYKYRVIKSLNGYMAGTLGCGCRYYGHTSPTRGAGPYGATDFVDDVAAVLGTWSASYDTKLSNQIGGRMWTPEVENGTGWEESRCWDYRAEDGWYANESASSTYEDPAVTFYNVKTHEVVRTPALVTNSLPQGYKWELSFDKKYPSSRGFYVATLKGAEDAYLFSDVNTNCMVNVGKSYYRVLIDALADGQDTWFREYTDFKSLFLVKTGSTYYMLGDGVLYKMKYCSKDDFYQKAGPFYWCYPMEKSCFEIRYYTKDQSLRPGPC